MTKYIAYYRVSTDKQGQSGLGLEAQQAAVQHYADSIVHSFTEIESGADNERPQLLAAIAMCRSMGATLLIAKIDRLSRDAGFLLTLRSSGLEILAADMPQVSTLEFGMRAVFSQHEREQISIRTRAALAAAKARGTQLGTKDQASLSVAGNQAIAAKADAYAIKVAGIVGEIKTKTGASTLRDIASILSARGVKTRRGNTDWHPSQVANVLRRAA
jgi:DNA invertase Pin-like site-specific DNA recombinase